jgi:hypothetical protein
MRSFTRTTAKMAIAVFMTFIAIFGVSKSASAATGVDGFPILHASTGDGAHKCHIIGGAYDQGIGKYVDAIVCADLSPYLLGGPNGDDVYGEADVEAYCQVEGTTTTVQCANIVATGELSAANGLRETYTWHCGHQYGACPTGRKVFGVGGDRMVNWIDHACGTNPDDISQMWGLVLAGTTIELPGSDDNMTLPSNFETGHYYVCY